MSSPPLPHCSTSRGVVFLAGFAASEGERLATALDGRAAMETVSSPDEVLSALPPDGPAVLCLGPGYGGDAGDRFALALGPAARRLKILSVAASPRDDGAGPAEAGARFHYRCPAPPPVDEMVELIVAALDERPHPPAAGAIDPEILEPVLQQLEAVDPEAAPAPLLRALSFAALALADAEGCEVFALDRAGDRLWSAGPDAVDGQVREHAVVGLTGFAARSCRTVRVAGPAADPRFDAAVDGGGGAFFEGTAPNASSDHLLAVPAGCGGMVPVVFRVRRDAAAGPFTAAEEERLRLLGEMAVPRLAHGLLEERFEEEMARRTGFRSGEMAEMFRATALQKHLVGEEADARPLKLSPLWMRWSYRFVLLCFLAVVLFAFFGRSQDYAVGHGVVVGHQGRMVMTFPGSYLPRLEAGMEGHFEVDGFRRGRQQVVLSSLSGEVLSPAEARRRIGEEAAGLLPLQGPVTVVWGQLDEPRFTSGGRAYELHPGMQGSVEVVVGSRRLLSALLPGVGGGAGG